MTPREFLRLFLPPIYYRMKENIIVSQERNLAINKKLNSKEELQKFIIEINKRQILRFDNIYELSRDISFDMLSSISIGDAEPNYYGAFYTLQKYALEPFVNIPPMKLTIQHGILYGMLEWLKEKSGKYNLVWSSQIKKMFDEELPNSLNIAIGCPFLYSESLLSLDQIHDERKRLGKNLLAIPMHSTHFIDNDYETEHFINILKSQKQNFDTIRICLYWRDIQRGTMQKFIDEGFECVCCGHMFDPLFLNRQRSLMEIADATISNGVGSHIGYSLFLHKPHWLVPDKFKLTDQTYSEGKEEQNIMLKSNIYRELVDSFCDNTNFVITREQQDLVDKIWGISCKKTKNEIKNLLNDAFYFSYN